MKKSIYLLALLAVAGCNSTPAPNTAGPEAAPSAPASDSLRQAVAAYIRANAEAFPGYDAVHWGQPTAYTKASEAAIKGVVAMQAFDDALVPRNQALAEYKTALAQHAAPSRVETIKARYGKANKYNDSLLAIANTFIGVTDSTRLGTQLVHAYRTKSKTGAVILDSAAFVVYPSGKVEQL